MRAAKNTWISEYFTFSKKDRRAVAILFLLAVLFSLLPKLFPVLVKSDQLLIIDTATQTQLVQMNTPTPSSSFDDRDDSNGEWLKPQSSPYHTSTSVTAAELFYFDPNTATTDEWKRLGLREKTIQTILNFRSKGGKFRKPEDLSKIYGLRTQDYERLSSYVRIGAAGSVVPASSDHSFPANNTSRVETVVTIDINLSDSTDWKKLKGIGPAYARRILNFRNKLGGFTSVDQVAETYGLPDSTFQQIKSHLINAGVGIRQINLNTASMEELKQHPYIRYSIANAIIQYRNQHGHFRSVRDLLQIGAIEESAYQKMAPYLTVSSQ